MKNLRSFSIAVACATALTAGCGAKTSGGGGGGGGNGTTSAASACSDYFQALLTTCPNDGFVSPSEPPSVINHVEARWTPLCEALVVLPGTSVTADTLEACASALATQGCELLETSTGACALGLPGTLPAGSSCEISAQCESSECTTGTSTPDGGTVTCGVCTNLLPVGASCANGQDCGTNEECLNDVCAATQFADEGASCAGEVQCKPGFACSPTSVTCVPPGGAGTPCESNLACEYPLICPVTASGSTSPVCASPGQVGAPCEFVTDCAAGLTCAQSSNTCATVTFVAVGAACNGDTVSCQIGECNPITGPGTCPPVIADGQPCSSDGSTTCDVFSECEEGTCVSVIGTGTCP